MPEIANLSAVLVAILAATACAYLVADENKEFPYPELQRTNANVVILQCRIPAKLIGKDDFRAQRVEIQNKNNVSLANITTEDGSPFRNTETLHPEATVEGYSDYRFWANWSLTVVMPFNDTNLGRYRCFIEYTVRRKEESHALRLLLDKPFVDHSQSRTSDSRDAFTARSMDAHHVTVTWVPPETDSNGLIEASLYRTTEDGSGLATSPRVSLLSVDRKHKLFVYSDAGVLLGHQTYPVPGRDPKSNYTISVFVESKPCQPTCSYKCEASYASCVGDRAKHCTCDGTGMCEGTERMTTEHIQPTTDSTKSTALAPSGVNTSTATNCSSGSDNTDNCTWCYWVLGLFCILLLLAGAGVMLQRFGFCFVCQGQKKDKPLLDTIQTVLDDLTSRLDQEEHRMQNECNRLHDEAHNLGEPLKILEQEVKVTEGEKDLLKAKLDNLNQKLDQLFENLDVIEKEVNEQQPRNATGLKEKVERMKEKVHAFKSSGQIENIVHRITEREAMDELKGKLTALNQGRNEIFTEAQKLKSEASTFREDLQAACAEHNTPEQKAERLKHTADRLSNLGQKISLLGPKAEVVSDRISLFLQSTKEMTKTLASMTQEVAQLSEETNEEDQKADQLSSQTDKLKWKVGARMQKDKQHAMLSHFVSSLENEQNILQQDVSILQSYVSTAEDERKSIVKMKEELDKIPEENVFVLANLTGIQTEAVRQRDEVARLHKETSRMYLNGPGSVAVSNSIQEKGGGRQVLCRIRELLSRANDLVHETETHKIPDQGHEAVHTDDETEEFKHVSNDVTQKISELNGEVNTLQRDLEKVSSRLKKVTREVYRQHGDDIERNAEELPQSLQTLRNEISGGGAKVFNLQTMSLDVLRTKVGRLWQDVNSRMQRMKESGKRAEAFRQRLGEISEKTNELVRELWKEPDRQHRTSVEMQADDLDCEQPLSGPASNMGVKT